jgi:hypothetical protein
VKSSAIYTPNAYEVICRVASSYDWEVMDGTTKTSADEQMVVDLPTKILDENINLNRIKKKFTIDGWKCLKKQN